MGCSRAIEPAEAEETSVYWKMVANYEEEVDIVAELWPRRILISSDQVAEERAAEHERVLLNNAVSSINDSHGRTSAAALNDF